MRFPDIFFISKFWFFFAFWGKNLILSDIYIFNFQNHISENLENTKFDQAFDYQPIFFFDLIIRY